MNVYNFIAWSLVVWVMWFLLCCYSDAKKNKKIEWVVNAVGPLLLSPCVVGFIYLVTWLFIKGAGP